ncbi:LacI family DNA-binding transcriptional regulator [Streptomyces sp. NPDC050315]|uniref:LacI family DNA-binding transcriptional regulator n=1 Tax=Streptomyces sp. NPDC050315 TaxID=3155039 RepID=UPI0034442ABB
MSRMPERVTISDVAAVTGVSKAAVSKAFNNRPGVSEETRQRILTAAARLGWRPNAAAVALAAGGPGAIGLILDRPTDVLSSDPFFPELLSGVERALAPLGYALLLRICTVGTAAEERALYTGLALEQRVEGVLVADPRMTDERIELLQELRLPAVLISRPWRESGLPWVGPEQPGAGIDLAVRHLARLGHRRIAYVRGPDSLAHISYRLRLFRDAVRECGMTAVAVEEADFTAAGGARATRALLRRPERPTAVVYDSDVMAIAGVQVAQECGLSVPDELSVVGHDDLPLSQWITPRLTTVRQDVQGLGERAALRLMQELNVEAPAPTPLPAPVLTERASTAPPRH